MSSSLSIKLEISGGDGLSHRLQDIQNKAKSPRPLYLMFGTHMKRIPARSMDEQRDPVTLRGWPQRKSISLLSRRGGGGKMLDSDGMLRKSFNASPINITDTGVSIGTKVEYARIHQRGGTIRGRGKKLTIPLSVEAAKAGGIRNWAKSQAGSKPFFFRSKRGTVFMATSEGKGKNRKLVLHWLLKDSVEIPARPYLGFGKRDKDKFVKDTIAYFNSGSKGGKS